MFLPQKEQERNATAFHHGHRRIRGTQQHLHVQITNGLPNPLPIDETTERDWARGVPPYRTRRTAYASSERCRHLNGQREARKLEERSRKQQ